MIGAVWMLAHDGRFGSDSIHYFRRFLSVATVASHLGMARMLACHQRGARRRADRAAGIRLSKPHPFGSHTVDVRRLDISLAIASQITVAHIVAKDKKDVRFIGRSRFVGSRFNSLCDH